MYQESTKPLLRPHQVENLKDEARRLEASLQAPPHVRAAIQDMGEMRKQLNSTVAMLEGSTPKPYKEEEVDAAVARENHLREEILKGMPTQAEMRRNPAGAVDKHRNWEKRNKEKILEWKNIRLRQHASGMTEDLADAKDVANFERYRPADASHEMNMHNEQIQGRVQHGPYSLTPATVFSDEDKALLEQVDPEIAKGLAMLNNDQRAAVKAFIQEHIEPATQTVTYAEEATGSTYQVDDSVEMTPTRKRREMTPEQKERARENLAKARAAKKAKEG